MVMVFNTTINNISAISWRSVLLVEETAVHGELDDVVVAYYSHIFFVGICLLCGTTTC
jgi:hypothetical protein